MENYLGLEPTEMNFEYYKRLIQNLEKIKMRKSSWARLLVPDANALGENVIRLSNYNPDIRFVHVDSSDRYEPIDCVNDAIYDDNYYQVVSPNDLFGTAIAEPIEKAELIALLKEE